MASTRSVNDLLPKDHQDMPAVIRISSLNSHDFAAIAPSLLPWMHYSEAAYIAYPLTQLFVTRMEVGPADPLVSTIDSLLLAPAPTLYAANLKHPLVYAILPRLPRQHIEPYRAALARLATRPTPAETAANERVPERSAELLTFLDASEAWVPRHKHDELALRTLREMVHTPEEMRPHVDGLLRWLKDGNWPPGRGCWEQLARFPQLALDPIREVLGQRDDSEWEEHLLTFLHECMPRDLMGRSRAEVERIVQRPTQSEIDGEAVEAAVRFLRAMDHRAARIRM
ncbi:hypothetical protein C8R46DRAFT_1059937 [Mycena filopes]|nr:hypothetical protein C8R46DRAFT_1059937 [Mycena filopes]